MTLHPPSQQAALALPTSGITSISARRFRGLAGGARSRILRTAPKHALRTAVIIEARKGKQRGNMLGIAQNPSTRSASKGLLCLKVVMLALLGALVLAGSARAAGPVAEPPAEAPPAGPGPEQPAKVPPAGPGPEQPGEVPPAGPAAGQPGEVPPAGPAAGQPAEVPPAGPAAGQPAEVPPAGKDPPGGTVTTKAPEGKLSPPASAPHDAATPHDAASEAAPEVPSALSDAPATAPTVGGPRRPSATSAAAPTSVGAPAGMTVARRGGDLRCELSALGGRMSDNCTSGWSGTQRLLSTSPTGSAAAAASFVAATRGAPAGADHDPSAVGRPPVSPTPGPAPGGASGASAMGGSALALSGFLTLAGLLLLGAPRAMRRLRLSCQPRLTACFVLIPERPG
jgi:hypothetical protein